MDTSKLITFGIVGLGLYLLYEWTVSQCESTASGLYGGSLCNTLIGTPIGAVAPVTTPTETTTPAGTTSTTPAITPAQATLSSLLTQAATGAGEDPTQLSPDQWSYYYQQIPGKPSISAATFQDILNSLGVTAATRSNPVSAAAFAAALVANGLSGMGLPYSAGWVPGATIHGRFA